MEKPGKQESRNMHQGMGYGRFAAMIATSTIVMFGLMYLRAETQSQPERQRSDERYA